MLGRFSDLVFLYRPGSIAQRHVATPLYVSRTTPGIQFRMIDIPFLSFLVPLLANFREHSVAGDGELLSQMLFGSESIFPGLNLEIPHEREPNTNALVSCQNQQSTLPCHQ